MDEIIGQELIDQFLKTMTIRNFAESTKVEYVADLKLFLRWVKKHPLHVTADDVANYQAELMAGQ
jgi:site-specific recombinase XerD